MNYRQISIALIATLLTSINVNAQPLLTQPKLLVTVIVDQLRTDYLEAFTPLYGENGFKINNCRLVLVLGCFEMNTTATKIPTMEIRDNKQVSNQGKCIFFLYSIHVHRRVSSNRKEKTACGVMP